jgi:hypothetical protein
MWNILYNRIVFCSDTRDAKYYEGETGSQVLWIIIYLPANNAVS